MSSRRLRSLLASALLLGATALTAHARLAVGDPFPLSAASSLEGPLPDLEGRVVLVDFWASWCAPCKASFPALAQLHADYAPRGVVILGVSVDDKPADYAAFLKKFAPPFPTVRDRAHTLAAAAKVPAMPSTFIIGRDGRVRAIEAGYHGATTEKALRAALEAALADTPSS